MSFSPSFQFYTKDWLSSLSILTMSPAEEGAYIRLLAFSWEEDDCGLPNDPQILSEISRLRDEWVKSSDKILKNFFLKDGKFFNNRLLMEREKQCHNKKARSIAGGQSAKSKPHLFKKSQYFNFEKFCDALPEWTTEKCEEWYQSAKSYSESKGATYLNWVSAVKNWERKESKTNNSKSSFQKFGRQEVSTDKLKEQAARMMEKHKNDL